MRNVLASLFLVACSGTTPRTAALSKSLATAIKAAGITMHRHPEQGAGFSVLKSPDIPSVLLELGFLSSAQDLTNLTNPEWRAQMAGAVRDGLTAWATEDRIRRAQPLH